MPLVPAKIPILMLSGCKDEIVPPEHMRALWEICRNRGKEQKAGARDIEAGLRGSKFVEFENGTHSE
jgi:fermentation-respiration switch protein FrsA (DUF1100 family)